MEYAEGGNLYEFLHNTKSVDYSIGHALSWAYQTAKGVSYLHQMKPKPLVHRDIKPPNLLLQDYCRKIKIGDFGTACDAKTHMSTNVGSYLWMAPEVFKSGKYSEKCDVYSWSITFWEILARQKPYPHNPNNPERNPEMAPTAMIWATCIGERPHKLQDCPKFVEDLINKCWRNEAKKRPPMVKVEQIMNKMVDIFVQQPLEKIELPENSITRTVFEAEESQLELAPDLNQFEYDDEVYIQSDPGRNQSSSVPQIIPSNMGTEPPRPSYMDGLQDRNPRNENPLPLPPRAKNYCCLSITNYQTLENFIPYFTFVNQSIKPIQPDEKSAESMKLYREHREKVAKFVLLDIELNYLEERKKELTDGKLLSSLPNCEDEIIDNDEEIEQLKKLNDNLQLQVQKLTLKREAKKAAKYGFAWI